MYLYLTKSIVIIGAVNAPIAPSSSEIQQLDNCMYLVYVQVTFIE